MAFISKKIEGLINLRIAEEENSSRLYLALAKWANFSGFTDAGKLWTKYSTEEMDHANWAYSYLEELDIKPEIPALEKPMCEYKGLEDICKQSYDHEVLVTNQCNDLAKAAMAEGDFMTMQLAQKYLAEQVEELGRQTHWLDRLEAFGNSKEALRFLDNEMAKAAQ